MIVSRFNSFISEQLLDGARDCLLRHGLEENEVDTFRVPGAFEIPTLASKLTSPSKYNAIICLGVLIRGATPHFDYIAGAVANAISVIGVTSKTPVTLGILTTDTIEQAIERAGTKAGNKGWEAALASIEMANLIGQLDE